MEIGGDGGWRQSISDGRTDSINLRALLKADSRNSTGVTLASVLSSNKRTQSYPVNRTLLDIIKEDSGGKDKKTWKNFKDKLRLRRSGSAWTSSVPIPTSDIPMQNNNNNNRMMTRRPSTRLQNAPDSDDPAPGSTRPELSSSASMRGDTWPGLGSSPSNRSMSLSRTSSQAPQRLGSRLPMSEEEEAMGETAEEAAEPEGEGGGVDPPVRMSLMALLGEGLDDLMADEEEEEDEEEESGAGGGREYNNCCVCMVRHKGAAFIPCGHTFCRLCSRELWVQRGNCPLCNNYILEILDIF